MNSIHQEELLKLVADYYLTSGDFNGINISDISSLLKLSEKAVIKSITDEIKSNKLRILSSESEINPHIIRCGFSTTEKQLQQINNKHVICVYPTKELLALHIDDNYLSEKPFSRKLAIGYGQLEFVFFDLSLLEIYRNDPRYHYECNDIGGQVCITDEHYDSDSIAEKDKVYIKSFGLAYDDNDNYNRYLCAFIGDIAELSAEHQAMWNSKLVNKQFKVHPDFYGSQILGRWPQHVPIFDAVLYEQQIINAMVQKLGKKPLFKIDYGKYLENKPKEFSFVLRPTSHEYNSFVHLLDKLMSDNIDKNFFKGEVDLEEDIERKDGKIQVIQKGTITLLDQWFRNLYSTDNWEPWDFVISVFKNIRKQRQNPAHYVNENAYDPSLIQKQRDLISDSYDALTILRHALSTHPKCIDQEFDIPEAIQNEKIWRI